MIDARWQWAVSVTWLSGRDAGLTDVWFFGSEQEANDFAKTYRRKKCTVTIGDRNA